MVTPEQHLDGSVTLYVGDSRDVLRSLPDNFVDSIVTDPPYALESIVKRFGGANAAPVKNAHVDAGRVDDPYARASKGFMGQTWDTGETAFNAEFWSEVMRVLKPGGWLVAASATRTYHRLATAIEGAGFEVRDMFGWIYGSGFPKRAGFLKPAIEPFVMARKALSEKTNEANIACWGVALLNTESCRIPMSEEDAAAINAKHAGMDEETYKRPVGVSLNLSVNPMPLIKAHAHELGRWPANIAHDGLAEDWARFFYCPKADTDERAGSGHPTVKPVELMRYLCRLVTPDGGLVMDPFAGSGTTGEAAWREGMRAILVEREEAYAADIRRRLELAPLGETGRKRAIAASKASPAMEGGLFDTLQ